MVLGVGKLNIASIILLGGFYPIFHYPKSGEFHLLFSGLKTIVAIVGDVIDCMSEGCFYNVIPDYGLVNASGFSGHIDDVLKSVGVYI